MDNDSIVDCENAKFDCRNAKVLTSCIPSQCPHSLGQISFSKSSPGLYIRIKLLAVVLCLCLLGEGKAEQYLEGRTWAAQSFFDEHNQTIPIVSG